MLSTRAGLSISMMVLGAFAIATGEWKAWRKAGWAWLGAVWVVGYVLSYFWSEDKAQWSRLVGVKMPVLLLPVAFALLPGIDRNRLRVLVVGFLSILLAGITYSLAQFLVDPASVIAGYNVSHVLPTPLFNGHIHFSALVACGVVVGAAALPIFCGAQKRLIAALLGVFVLYIHILASKTGLVMLYLFGLLLLLRLASRGRPLYAAGYLLAGAAAVVAAFTFIPTLNKRAHYVNYTIIQVLEGRRDGLYSDLGRALSWEVAARVATQYPLGGVGAGDVLSAMRTEYAASYPDVSTENHLVPHNQLLCVAVAAGLPTLAAFVLWMLAPLRWQRRHPRRFYLRAIWLMLLVPLLVEPFLEVQGGVAVYLYALLFCQYVLRCMAAEVPGQGWERPVPE